MALVFELRAASGSSRGTLASVGHKLGVNPETLRNWVEKAEIDSGQRPGSPDAPSLIPGPGRRFPVMLLSP